MDFHAIKLVLQSLIASAGAEVAGVGRWWRLISIGEQLATRRGGVEFPDIERSNGGAGRTGWDGHQLDLPDRLHPRRGVDAVQRRLDQRRFFQHTDMARPDIDHHGIIPRRESRDIELGGTIGEQRPPTGQMRLNRQLHGSLIFDQHTIDIKPPGRKAQQFARAIQRQSESGIVDGRACRADHITGGDVQAVTDNILCLIAVGIELHTALLLADRGIMPLSTEAGAGKIAFHGRCPPLEMVVIGFGVMARVLMSSGTGRPEGRRAGSGRWPFGYWPPAGWRMGSGRRLSRRHRRHPCGSRDG